MIVKLIQNTVVKKLGLWNVVFALLYIHSHRLDILFGYTRDFNGINVIYIWWNKSCQRFEKGLAFQPWIICCVCVAVSEHSPLRLRSPIAGIYMPSRLNGSSYLSVIKPAKKPEGNSPWSVNFECVSTGCSKLFTLTITLTKCLLPAYHPMGGGVQVGLVVWL